MIIQGDARKPPYIVRARLVYADPPSGRGKNEGAISDRMSDIDYQQFALSWLSATIRVPGLMAEDSRLVLCTFPILRRVYENLIYYNFPELKFEQEVIWHYDFGTYTRKHFVPSHDNILIYRMGNPSFYWEDVAIKSQRLQVGDSRADVRGRTPGTVWSIPRVTGNSFDRAFVRGTARTCQPEALCERILLAYTEPGDKIYDPFAGTGTMGVVCKSHDRRYYGLEICNYYCKDIEERLNKSNWMWFLREIGL